MAFSSSLIFLDMFRYFIGIRDIRLPMVFFMVVIVSELQDIVVTLGLFWASTARVNRFIAASIVVS